MGNVSKLWNPRFTLLLVVNLLCNLGFSVVMTTITSYTLVLGASLSVAGSIASVFSLAAMLVRPFGGYLFDRTNRKAVYITSTMAMGFVVLGYAFTNAIPLLLSIRVLHGIFFGLSTTAAMALATRFLPREKTGEGLGYFNAGTLVGQALGPVIGSALISSLGYKAVYEMIAVSMILPPLLFVQVKLPMEKRNMNAPEPFSWKSLIDPRFLVFAVVSGLFSYYNGVLNSFVLPIGEMRGIPNVSLFFTVATCILLAVRLMLGKMTDRGNLCWIVLFSLTMTLISMLVLSCAQVLWLFLIAAVCKALGQGLGHIALQGEAMKRADAAHTGVVASTMLVGSDLGNTLGPSLSGCIAEYAGYEAMFYFGAALTIAMGILFWVYTHRFDSVLNADQ